MAAKVYPLGQTVRAVPGNWLLAVPSMGKRRVGMGRGLDNHGILKSTLYFCLHSVPLLRWILQFFYTHIPSNRGL